VHCLPSLLAWPAQTAQSLNKEDCWNRLAVEALRQGNHAVVEMAYQQASRSRPGAWAVHIHQISHGRCSAHVFGCFLAGRQDCACCVR
jgi:hypothetical protein